MASVWNYRLRYLLTELVRQGITESKNCYLCPAQWPTMAYMTLQVLNEVRSIEKSIIRVCYKRLWHGWSRQSTGHSAVCDPWKLQIY